MLTARSNGAAMAPPSPSTARMASRFSIARGCSISTRALTSSFARSGVLEHAGVPLVLGAERPPAPDAPWWIQRRGDGLLGFLARGHHRHDDIVLRRRAPA